MRNKGETIVYKGIVTIIHNSNALVHYSRADKKDMLAMADRFDFVRIYNHNNYRYFTLYYME